MRLRNDPKALEKLQIHDDIVFIDPMDMKGQWSKVFGNDNPIYIEIGMGKGYFIIENAKRFPEINFIGIEKYPTVLNKALNKCLDENLDNLRLMKADAKYLNEIFDENEVDKIYLNFSDPWPKKKHAQRRLTSSSFLDIYKVILKGEKTIEFKTDNRGLFEYSLLSFNTYPVKFLSISLDLHQSEKNETNIQTEYERKFSPYGPIYFIEVTFND